MRTLRIPPRIKWELLVVNNNSPDDTERVLDSFRPFLPLKPLFEEKQGQCWARNTAIRAAQGDLLIWTDDDVLVDPEWLAEYAHAADENKEIAFFGGTIDPWFEEPPPDLLAGSLDFLQGPFAIRRFGIESRPFARGELPFGANMAFRTDILRRYPFNTEIGHIGTNPRGGDEVEVMERMLNDGLNGMWVGSARVRHFVPKERATVAYLQQWFRSSGSVLARNMAASEYRTMFGVPRYVVRQYMEARLTKICCAPTGGRRWLQAMLRSEQLQSAIKEYRNGLPRASASKD